MTSYKHKGRISPLTILPSDSRDNQPKPINEPVRISFEHIDNYKKQCLSCCNKDEIKSVIGAFRQLTMMSWNQVRESGTSSGGKVGLGHTRYPHMDDLLPEQVKATAKMVGIRASEKFRIYGFHFKQVFYVLMFDKDHDQNPV